MAWPIIPIHAALMPDGRVLNYGSDVKSASDPNPQLPGANPTTSFNYDVWSPSMGFGDASHLTLTNNTGNPGTTSVDFFCSAQLLLPEPTTASTTPSVLIVGGDTYPRTPGLPDTDNNDGNPNSVLVGDNNLLSKGPDMNRGRWYATVTTLLNGDIYIQGGKGKTFESGIDHPELRSAADKRFHLLSSIKTGDKTVDVEGNDPNSYRYYYPRNFVAPDGKVFGFDTFGRMYTVDPYANAGLGALTPLSASPAGISFAMDYIGDDSTASMFSPGRILQVGARSNNAMVIDIRNNPAAPLLKQTGSFSRRRQLGTSTLLPTGEVLLTGGSEQYNELVNPSKGAEIWSPVTGTWRLGSEEVVARLYHSTALLMANGSVLIGGGGGPGPHSNPADLNSPLVNNFNAEVYFPPYLFSAGAKLAPRPGIVSVSADPQVRRSFTLDFVAGAGGLARVTLIKSGSVTHGFNMDQRFIELSFITRSARQLEVRMPSNAADTPPGYYLLFVIDAAGVPSVAKTVFVNTAFAPDAAQDPVIGNPGDRSNTAGIAVTPFNLNGSDPNGPVTFAAGGLPPGIVVSTAGVVSGTPTTAGTYNAVVSASDGARTATANFVWTVN